MSQRSQLKARVGSPVHIPGEAVRVWPSTGVPPIDGRTRLTGALGHSALWAAVVVTDERFPPRSKASTPRTNTVAHGSSSNV